MQQQEEKALAALEQYSDIVCGYKFPLKLKGNEYFDQVDTWLEENVIIGTRAPMDNTTVKANFIKAVEENPAFAPLKENDKYKRIVKKLKRHLSDNKA